MGPPAGLVMVLCSIVPLYMISFEMLPFNQKFLALSHVPPVCVRFQLIAGSERVGVQLKNDVVSRFVRNALSDVSLTSVTEWVSIRAPSNVTTGARPQCSSHRSMLCEILDCRDEPLYVAKRDLCLASVCCNTSFDQLSVSSTLITLACVMLALSLDISQLLPTPGRLVLAIREVCSSACKDFRNAIDGTPMNGFFSTCVVSGQCCPTVSFPPPDKEGGVQLTQRVSRRRPPGGRVKLAQAQLVRKLVQPPNCFTKICDMILGLGKVGVAPGTVALEARSDGCDHALYPSSRTWYGWSICDVRAELVSSLLQQHRECP